MAMYVNTNVASLNGQRNLQNVTDRMNSSFEKLSSGSRINSARDDAAGLQIADRLTTQLTGLNQGNRNANDGISIAQIAEGAIGEITSNVQRMRQLAVQGGNRTLSSDDRDALGQEFQKLLDTNDDIAERTAYGTIKLLNYESNEAGFQIQSGAQSGEQDTVTTGNAKLTAMFGKIMEAEFKNGTIPAAAANTGISVMSATDLSNMGTLGKLVGAHMLATNQSDKSVSMEALFGVANVATAHAKDLSQLAEVSGLQIQSDELTKILTATVSTLAGGADTSALVSAIGSNLLGIASADVQESDGGYTDAELNTLHGFMTDALLDGMSALVDQADKQRAKLGAEQNGLMSTVRSNTAAVVNVSDSRARITDTDFATETAELTRNQIIQQAATSILSQANQLPNAALSLLR
jgi:flagellin